ncbi:hypothetical protein FRC00_006302 [Tulasnella sp. 408]|nr:hypothetical protein FRC00_006302 [Tulasnella sp. 408]
MHSTCDPTDTNNACLCKDDHFLRSSTTCIQSYCSAEDFATAANSVQKLCKAAGVDISTDPAAQPTSTATATSAASAATTSIAASAATASAAASATPTGNAAAGTVVGKVISSVHAQPCNILQPQQNPSNMRFSTVLVAFAVSVAAASFLSERQSDPFPPCVLPCLTNVDRGSCAYHDTTCLCKSDAFLRATTICRQNLCSPEDSAIASQVGQALCKAAGVDVSSNPAAQDTGVATNNAATGPVVGKGIMVGGFVTAATVLAL